jgi:small-conductance mechanosensitive channel
MTSLDTYLSDVEHTLLGVSLKGWLIALATALAVRVAIGLLRRALTGRLGRWLGSLPGRYDDAVVATLVATRSWVFWVFAIYAGASTLALPQRLSHALGVTAATLVLLQIGLWGQDFTARALGVWTQLHAASGAASRVGTAASAIRFIAGLVIWTLVVLLALQNAGIEIGALLAGLGVGGIAAALALQTVLGDLFASLSIYTDRPFDLGDFIIVGDYMGTVEAVGLRSTRLSSLGGEQIIIPNGHLMSNNIRNYKRMSQRRVVSQVSVAYGTPRALLLEIPATIRRIIEGTGEVRFDRAHFAGPRDAALSFEFVYYVLSADYNVFMDRQQHIFFELLSALEASGAKLAVPVRSLHLHRAQPDAEPAAALA